MAQWYYTQNGQQAGPVEDGQLQALISSGQVGPAEMAWKDGMANWQAVSTLPELAGPAMQPAATPYGQYGQPAYPGAYAQPAYGQPAYGQPAYGNPNTGAVNYYTPQAPSAVGYAGFWLRFVAYIIDIIILTIPLFILGLIVGFALGASGNADEGTMQVVQVFLQLIAVVVQWLYFAMQESSAAQATLGKRILGLRVTDINGQRLTFGHATGRFFAKILSGLTCAVGYIMAGFTERKQALHDMVAKTLVVTTR